MYSPIGLVQAGGGRGRGSAELWGRAGTAIPKGPGFVNSRNPLEVSKDKVNSLPLIWSRSCPLQTDVKASGFREKRFDSITRWINASPSGCIRGGICMHRGTEERSVIEGTTPCRQVEGDGVPSRAKAGSVKRADGRSNARAAIPLGPGRAVSPLSRRHETTPACTSCEGWNDAEKKIVKKNIKLKKKKKKKIAQKRKAS